MSQNQISYSTTFGTYGSFTGYGSVNYNVIITQREVAEVAGVTEVTIRNRYKELIQNLNIELDI